MVFLTAAMFYLWTADTTYPLALHGGLHLIEGETDRYNQLANSFLHFRLSVGPAPRGLLSQTDPYDPSQNGALLSGINDDLLYGGRLYLLWGPAPVVVLLVPMHLLGFIPTPSLTDSIFAITGLGFALATLRVLLKQVADAALWMCVLAGVTLALASIVPFIERSTAVNQEAILGGFCFTMAGVWLAISALASRRASLWRLVLMSLCFGLAAGSRPTLGLTALVLVPVYMSLRSTRPHRGLLLALSAPVGMCFLLLLAYNQARFGNPLEFGEQYQLAGYNPKLAHFGDRSYVPPGAWFYLVSPPRPTILFPFLQLGPPPMSYPAALPTKYLPPERTAGLLPMAPIVIFLVALPRIWRRRPGLLGPLALPLLILAGAGMGALVFLSYQIPATTQRYEVDFATLFLLGALAAWIALSTEARGARRWLLRIGGGLLAAWSCLTGLATSFSGPANLLATEHPGTWNTLQKISSPLSTAIAAATGGPVLADVSAANVLESSPVTYDRLTAEKTGFWLHTSEQANLTIVSPDTRTVALTSSMFPAVLFSRAIQDGPGATAIRLRGPGAESHIYSVPLHGGVTRIPVRLRPGLNHLVLNPITNTSQTNAAVPVSQQLLVIKELSLANQ